MSFFTAIISIQILAAILMVVLIAPNPIVSADIKRGFISIFILLGVISLLTWLNVCLNGAPKEYIPLHYIVKTMEFCLVPATIAVGIGIFRNFTRKKLLWAFVLVHAVFEIAAAFFGLVFYIDSENVYARGSLYFIYVVFYMVEVLIVALEFVAVGKKYQNRNPLVIIVSCIFVSYGVLVQVFLSGVKTGFLTGEIAMIIAYSYVNNMILQTDKITGLLNRWCYEKKLNEINYETCLLIFDIDSFKSINDTFGHQVGDECLLLTASLLTKVFSREGYIYRIGGDEFCVIIKKKSKYADKSAEERIKALISKFEQEVRAVHTEEPRFTAVSVGYAYTDPEMPIEWSVERADKEMYEVKERNKIQD